MLTYFLLALSVFLMFLTAGMAWMARGVQGYPEQRMFGMVLWVFYVLSTFFMLKVAGISTVVAAICLLLVSAIGYFIPNLETFLIRYRDPGIVQVPPEAPPE